MRVPFGKPDQSIDSVELRDGVAEGLIDGYMRRLGDQEAFIKRRGLKLFATHADAQPIDGLYQNALGTVLGVSNGKVFRINANQTLTAFTGDLVSVGKQCRWAEDSGFTYLATDTHLAKLNVGTLVCTLLDGVGGQPLGPGSLTHVVTSTGAILSNGFLSGGASGDVHFSEDQGATWLTYNNERQFDSTESLLEDNDEVYAWGGRSIEASYNDGDTPWAVRPGGYTRYGTRARYSAVRIAGSFFYLGNYDGAPKIMRLVERQPVPISSPYDKVLAAMVDISEARAWGVIMDEWPFYVITWPTAKLTLAYNILHDHWCQWSHLVGGTREAFLGNCFLYAVHSDPGLQKNFVGDRRATGRIYTFEGLQDHQDTIRFELTSGHISHGNAYRKPCGRMLFKCKRGQTTGQGAPSFTVATRDDGRPNFGPDRQVSLGAAGETEFFGAVNRCGAARERQYRVRHDDATTDFVFVWLDVS